MFLGEPWEMMTYSKGALMQVEVSSHAILVFNEISSGGVSCCQVSNHLKGSLLFSLSNGEKEHPHYRPWLWLIRLDKEMSRYKYFNTVPQMKEEICASTTHYMCEFQMTPENKRQKTWYIIFKRYKLFNIKSSKLLEHFSFISLSLSHFMK